MPKKSGRKEELMDELVIRRLRGGEVADLENRIKRINRRTPVPNRPVLQGEGFFGDLWDSAKALGTRVVSTVKAVGNVLSGKAPRENLPPYVRKILATDGVTPIRRMIVRRDPLQKAIDFALNAVSAGNWNQAKQKYGYDVFFHLALEVVLESGKRYVIEKNEVIQISDAKPFTEKTESMEVPMGGQGATMNSLLNGSKQILGANFYTYDAFRNNCQDFVLSILKGSGIGSDAIRGFVKQPIDGLILEVPSLTGKVARGITDLGGVIDTFLYGEGGMKPSKRFSAQMKKMGVNPVDYLAEAKRKAKSLGLAHNMLGFSSDDNHKLQIPNASGEMIRFGSVGNGDFLLYTLSGDPFAKEDRKSYRARATKIRGDWKKDPYSKNSLSLSIQW